MIVSSQLSGSPTAAWHDVSVELVIDWLDSRAGGLSMAEAGERLAALHGPNRILVAVFTSGLQMALIYVAPLANFWH